MHINELKQFTGYLISSFVTVLPSLHMFPDEISDSLEGGCCRYQLEITNEKPRCCVHLLPPASFDLFRKGISPHLGMVRNGEMTRGSVEEVENASDFTYRSDYFSEEVNAEVYSRMSLVCFLSISSMPTPVSMSRFQILITIIHARKRISSTGKWQWRIKQKGRKCSSHCLVSS